MRLGEDRARLGEDRARPGEDQARPGERKAVTGRGRSACGCLEGSETGRILGIPSKRCFGKGVGNRKNASEMLQKSVKMGLVLLGKEERSKMRQKCVKIASKMRQNCAEHLWRRTPFGRCRNTVRRVRFQTPNSVSFLGLAEFRGANSVSSSRPIICAPSELTDFFAELTEFAAELSEAQ